jgi:hypothetical protein
MLNFPKLPPNDEHKTTFSRPLHSELRNETRKQCEAHNNKQWKLFITNSRENKHKRSFFHGSLEARIRSLTQLGQLPNTGPRVPISRLAMTGGKSLCHMNLDPIIYPSAVQVSWNWVISEPWAADNTSRVLVKHFENQMKTTSH